MYRKVIMRGGALLLTTVWALAAQDRWTTVFLHGGGAHPLYLNLSDTFRIINDKVEQTVYAITTQLLRNDPYFFQVQPQQGEGLKRAFPAEHFDPHNGANLFGLLFDIMSQYAHFPSTELYSFGWSGFLSIKARRLASIDLYEKLHALYRRILEEGDTPHIRVIAYSHGGNVALHMGEIAKQRGISGFVIDELILVATPVHVNSREYLSIPLFKNIFSVYSIGDNIQSSDFLSSPTHSFAHRSFQELAHFKLPPNVTQIQVRILRKHIVVKQKDGSRRVIKRYDMVHPNHTEMFFFGWTPEWYRKHFPLKPLPVAGLLPLLISYVYSNHLAGKDVRFTISPDDERVTIDVKGTQKTLTVPFMPLKKFDELRNQLWRYKPLDIDQYKSRMRKHWESAKRRVRQENKQKARVRQSARA